MSTSLESFVNVLRRSGLLEESAITQSVEEIERRSLPKTGESLAEQLTAREAITAWQASKLLQGKHKGFFLGKYKLLRLLGKGGMSSVYLAEHVLMRRRCAIKVLPWKLVKDSSYLQRFHREAQAVASLDHPNIVRAYDIDHETDGSLEIHFLVMEFVEGRNLYDLVQQVGPLSPVLAAEYIRQGALGLEHAHQSGMVHRDVKPGNFIVDQNGTVKLMDLGLARVAAKEDHSLTIAHDERVLGTADYLAPEQAVDSHLVDTRADIYSLGCTFYFLLTGRPPFNEGTLTQRLLAHQTKEPTPPESIRPEIPESLLIILRGMMVKDREQRIQSASDVAALLTNWLETDYEEEPSTQQGQKQAAQKAVTREEGRSGGPPRAGSADVTSVLASGRERPSAEGSLGSFLSSLSDVGGPESTKQPSSLLPVGPPATMKIHNSETEAGDDASQTLHQDHFDFDSDDQQNPFAASGRSGTRSGSRSGTRKSSSQIQQATSRSKIQKKFAIPPLKTLLPAPVIEQLKRNRIPIAAGGGLLLLLLVTGTFFLSRKSSSSPTATTIPAASSEPRGAAPVPEPAAAFQRPAVDGPIIEVGPKGHYGTLREAIEFVKISSLSSLSTGVNEIRIASNQTLKEVLSIDNSGLGGFPQGIKIIGQSTDAIPKLQPDGNGPCIQLNSVEGLTIENLIIDCQGRTTAIALEGTLTGTHLTGLTFENLQKTGITAMGASGVIDRPMVIEKCRFRSSSSATQGIVLKSDERSDIRDLTIRQCQFLGPMDSAITVNGSTATLDIRENILTESRSGIVFSGSGPVFKKIRVVNNTFLECGSGIQFETTPGNGSSGFVIENNLFAKQSGAAASASDSSLKLEPLLQGGAARFNWTDGPNEGLTLFEKNGVTGKTVDFKSVDPAAADFLKPTTAEIHSPGAPGSLKYFGAVAP